MSIKNGFSRWFRRADPPQPQLPLPAIDLATVPQESRWFCPSCKEPGHITHAGPSAFYERIVLLSWRCPSCRFEGMTSIQPAWLRRNE